jgi:hypothetical protein
MRFACRGAFQRRSRGQQCDCLVRSAARPAERRCRGADCGEAVLRDPRAIGGWPSKRRAAAGDGRAGRPSCPAPDTGHGHRARARMPCPSSPTPERSAAAGLNVSVTTQVAIPIQGTFPTRSARTQRRFESGGNDGDAIKTLMGRYDLYRGEEMAGQSLHCPSTNTFDKALATNRTSLADAARITGLSAADIEKTAQWASTLNGETRAAPRERCVSGDPLRARA